VIGERLALARHTPLHWFMPSALHGADAPIQCHGLRLPHLSPYFFRVFFLNDLFWSILKDVSSSFYLDPLVALQVFMVLIHKDL